jgi:hypothetical protein
MNAIQTDDLDDDIKSDVCDKFDTQENILCLA